VEEYAGLPCQGQEAKGTGARARTIFRSSALPVPVLLGALFLVSSACDSGGDGPPSPPESVLGFLEAEQAELRSPVPGLTYYRLVNSREPWEIHLLRMDLDRCELGLRLLEAPAEEGSADGRARVSELALSVGPSVLAAVNGDFFTPEGRPLGTEVAQGLPRRVLGRPALAWRPGADLWMGYPEIRDDSLLAVGWVLPRERGDGRTQAVGGFPLLLLQGSRVGDLEVGERPSFAADRHPRTAVGFDQEERLLWAVVVDGRQAQRSAGMTLPELADLLAALGIEDAINLDGGGSSVMFVDGDVVSSPSDAEGERPVGNALGIFYDPALCQLAGG